VVLSRNPDLFPARNRIIAGLSDCTIVIETDTSGGSIITAYLAHDYNRDVFALPGRYNDHSSSGCNMLIRKNMAVILNDAEELTEYMDWTTRTNAQGNQLAMPLFESLSADEDRLVKILRTKGRLHIDELTLESGQQAGPLSALLLDLEFRNIIRSLPGKRYDLVK
jgi:DNA processing protein